MNQLAVKNGNGALDPAIIASLVLDGDLSKLNDAQRVAYYNYRCHQIGLDPAAKPFDLLRLGGKLVLYANNTCSQLLCRLHGLSPTIKATTTVEGIFIVTSQVVGKDGRTTENLGAVPIEGLKGEIRSNAVMKGVTKAHRRTVLYHCGLGMLDETEVDSIPNAQMQGRGNPLRQEFAALSYELDACKSQEQIDLLLESPEFKDFEERDSKQSSGMSFAGMMRDKAEQMKKKLPERIRYEGNKIVAATNAEAEFANAEQSVPSASAAEPYEGETITPADRKEMDYMASVDSCDTVDEVKKVRRDIEGDKDMLGTARFAALKKACVARVKEIEIGATLTA